MTRIKFVEIRDKGTFIPAVAIDCSLSNEIRAGWQPEACSGKCGLSWRDPDYEYDRMRDERDFCGKDRSLKNHRRTSMLYDPKWEQQTKADPFTLESLIAWLETMPRKGQYPFQNCEGQCLYGQYQSSLGISWRVGDYGKITAELSPYIAAGFPWTFGAALTRARAELVKRVP